MLSALEKRCHNQSRSSSSVLLSPARIVDEHMNGSCSATWVARCLIESADTGSAAMGTMLPLHSAAVVPSTCRYRPVMYTVAPFAARACVMVRPMPVPPPVTTHLSLGTEKSLGARSRLLGILRTGVLWSCGVFAGVYPERNESVDGLFRWGGLPANRT